MVVSGGSALRGASTRPSNAAHGHNTFASEAASVADVIAEEKSTTSCGGVGS
jgi:hypothetical protein